MMIILSAIFILPLRVEATGRVFFASGDVAFAEPMDRHTAGDAVLASAAIGDAVVVRRNGADAPVARGWIFKVRPEHLTIKVTEGDVRTGDHVERGGSGEPVGAMNATAQAPRVGTPRAASRTILVARIRNAPAIVAAQFDSSFVPALLREEEGAGREAGAIRIYAWRLRGDRAPASDEIRAAARRRSASIVILPRYLPGSDGDSIEVRVHSAESGDFVGSSITRVLPFADLHYLPVGRRIGRLEYKARYDGLVPAPRSIAFSPSGDLIVGAGGDAFWLAGGVARLKELEMAPVPAKRATWERDGRLWSATIEIGRGRDRGGEMVVIREGDEIVYRSGIYDRVTSLAADDGLLAVLSGTTIELLRVE